MVLVSTASCGNKLCSLTMCWVRKLESTGVQNEPSTCLPPTADTPLCHPPTWNFKPHSRIGKIQEKKKTKNTETASPVLSTTQFAAREGQDKLSQATFLLVCPPVSTLTCCQAWISPAFGLLRTSGYPSYRQWLRTCRSSEKAVLTSAKLRAHKKPCYLASMTGHQCYKDKTSAGQEAEEIPAPPSSPSTNLRDTFLPVFSGFGAFPSLLLLKSL